MKNFFEKIFKKKEVENPPPLKKEEKEETEVKEEEKSFFDYFSTNVSVNKNDFYLFFAPKETINRSFDNLITNNMLEKRHFNQLKNYEIKNNKLILNFKKSICISMDIELGGVFGCKKIKKRVEMKRFEVEDGDILEFIKKFDKENKK